jgi:hypothetical protein
MEKETIGNLVNYLQQVRTNPTTNNTNTQATASVVSTSDTSSSLSSRSLQTSAMNTIFSLLATNPVPTTMPTTEAYTVPEEIGNYISSIQRTSSFASFWTEHYVKLPLMAAVVRRIRNIPATSVSSESSFSDAGYIARKQRSSFASDAIRYSLVLKHRHCLKLPQKLILNFCRHRSYFL